MKSNLFLHRLKIALYYFLSIFLIIIYSFLIAWTYCYSLYVGYLLAAAFVASIIIFTINKSKKQSIKFLLLGGLLFVILLPLNLRQYNNHAETLQKRINNNQELNTKERLGIYGCLIMVTVFDIIPFPEVATENFYLFFPDQDHKRVFHSQTFLTSPSVLREVKRKTLGYVTWNKWSSVFDPDFRYALAFDPCLINTVTVDNHLLVTLTKEFAYRSNHTTIHANGFMRGWFAFRIDEGLFYYLQEKGWLHPYTAIWKAEIVD